MADVSELLRHDIVAGRFRPGERLTEIQLTERYGVGRAAVRSAIVELSSEGLVEHEANRGATVRRVSLDAAIEIAEARGVLEGLLAGKAADRATGVERAELGAIVDAMRAAVVADRQATYSELNLLLHRRVREISGHATAADLVANLADRAAHHRFRLAALPGRAADSLGQHAAIVEAIAAGDADAAAQAMQDHLASVQRVLRSLAEPPPSEPGLSPRARRPAR